MNFIKTKDILIRALRKLPSSNNQTASLSSVPSQNSKNEVYVSICIERQPVITKKKTNIEEKMQKTLNKIEFEKSKKSNFDLLKEGKIQLLKKMPEEYISQTAVDIEEISKTELENLKTAPRTSDEKTNNLKNRLSESLFLLTEEHNESEKDAWLLPKGIVNEGETLKQAARRILNQCCGDKFNAFIYGSAPIGYINHKSNDCKNEEKVFCFLARYESGSITTKNKYKWLTADELVKVLPQNMYQYIKHFYKTSK